MRETDGTAARTARSLNLEATQMAGVTDTYIREQLEKRRDRLNAVLASSTPAASSAPLVALLGEVDSALQRLANGSYGICTQCHDPVEKDRLLADPLAQLCLDHLTIDEQRALERDLELAARVQRGLLPSTDTRHQDWLVHYQYKPAGMVSGDYCDVISSPTENGEMFFLLGDVAGKGVAASLLMSHLHAMFRSLAGVGLPLDNLMEQANSVFCQSTIAGQYATLICGRAGQRGEIEINSAGHLAALHVSKNGVRRIYSTGLPLGMFSTSRYTVERIRLDRGDSLLLYTDGLSEAMDESGTEYGTERLSNFVRERQGCAPQDLAAACIKDVDAHRGGGKQLDDQTLMVVHRGTFENPSAND